MNFGFQSNQNQIMVSSLVAKNWVFFICSKCYLWKQKVNFKGLFYHYWYYTLEAFSTLNAVKLISLQYIVVYHYELFPHIKISQILGNFSYQLDMA